MRQNRFVILVAFAIVLAFGEAAWAQEEPAEPTAELAFVGDEEVAIEFSVPRPSDPDALVSATTDVLLQNTGERAAGPLSFDVFLAGHHGDSALVVEAVDADQLLLSPFETSPITLRFTLELSEFEEQATLEAVAPDGVKPVTLRLLLLRTLPPNKYYIPIVWGVLGAVSTLALCVLWLKVQYDEVDKDDHSLRGRLKRWRMVRYLRKRIYTGSAWSFKDSWATNLATLGAVLTTVLAATGFIDELFPGLSMSFFIGLNLLFGGMVVAAPMIYAGLGRRWQDKSDPKVFTVGSLGGLLLAASVTLWGVYGQLTTMGLLSLHAIAPLQVRLFFVVVLGLAAVGAGIYSVQNVRWLAEKQVDAGATDAEKRELDVNAVGASLSSSGSL